MLVKLTTIKDIGFIIESIYIIEGPVPKKGFKNESTDTSNMDIFS